ncbi:RhoGAP domain-containing protein [Aphelenchoides avenae]|nr:RhoGAP domain-containing protein [Aphelenchus avenae]
MDYIRRNAEDAEGVFRRNGARQRIERIRNTCNSLGPDDPIPQELLRESEFTDLADALKMYFRELPEPIMTDRLSEMLIEAGNALPEDQRFLVAHYCTLLLPSENRQALLILLAFLREVSEYSPTNKMSADNLATCLMPSLCRLSPAFGPVTGLKRRKTISMPSEKDRTEYNLMKSFLAMMITDWRKLLVLPSDLARERDASQLDVHTDMKLPLKDGRFDLRTEYQRQLTHLHDELLQEYRHDWDGWQLMRFFSDGTQLFVKDADDELPIRLFRVQVLIPAPVSLVHAAILRNRKSWDMNVLGCKKIAPTGQSYDVIKVTYGDAVSGTEKYAYLARRWTYGKVTGDNVCTIVERSVSPFASSRFETKPRVNVLKSSFIIVPDAGYSQLNFISRMDVGGKTSLWYDRVYGTMLAEQMRRFRNQFLNTRLTLNGRETVI